MTTPNTFLVNGRNNKDTSITVIVSVPAISWIKQSAGTLRVMRRAVCSAVILCCVLFVVDFSQMWAYTISTPLVPLIDSWYVIYVADIVCVFHQHFIICVCYTLHYIYTTIYLSVRSRQLSFSLYILCSSPWFLDYLSWRFMKSLFWV